MSYPVYYDGEVEVRPALSEQDVLLERYGSGGPLEWAYLSPAPRAIGAPEAASGYSKGSEPIFSHPFI
jgi:hypothetical protein